MEGKDDYFSQEVDWIGLDRIENRNNVACEHERQRAGKDAMREQNHWLQQFTQNIFSENNKKKSERS